jgi:MoxR-like ATPase
MSIPTDWELYELVLSFDGVRIIYVWGPPGVGKTFGAFHFGRVEKGFYAVTLTDETSAAELRGHFIFKGGDTVWHDGPFARAMREGKRLVINEIGNASADVLALFFPILESWETAELTLPTGETLRPASGFHVVATDNRAPDQLPEALQDRFVAYVRVMEPHPDALAGLDPQFQKFAHALKDVDPERAVSARGWRNLQDLSGAFGLDTACRLVFGPDRGAMMFDAMTLAKRARAKRARA